jgi:putative flippase GtrA
MPRQTFYYAACGGGNTLFSIFIFFVTYNYVLQKKFIETPFITISPHIGAMIVSFAVGFPTGFYLAKNIVFSGSHLQGNKQLFRYLLTTLGSLLLNYINLKILVDLLHFYPTIAQVCNTIIVVIFSYLAQKYFAFKKMKVT